MPNSALAMKIQGMREAKAAFQALPELMRNRLNVATETTASEIARQAKAQILASPSVRTRTLYNAIAYTMNVNNGHAKVGVSNVTTTISINGRKIKVKGRLIAGAGGSASTSAGAKLIRPSRYAHFIEFGSRKMNAEPFMMPATEAEKGFYLQRCQGAGKAIEQDMAAVGARTL